MSKTLSPRQVFDYTEFRWQTLNQTVSARRHRLALGSLNALRVAARRQTKQPGTKHQCRQIHDTPLTISQALYASRPREDLGSSGESSMASRRKRGPVAFRPRLSAGLALSLFVVLPLYALSLDISRLLT